MWITMECVVITVQVDMNLIFVKDHEVTAIKEDDDKDDERIIKILDLDGSWCQLLTLFWRSLSGHIIIFCIVFQM